MTHELRARGGLERAAVSPGEFDVILLLKLEGALGVEIR
jgi:hypothetical protein